MFQDKRNFLLRLIFPCYCRHKTLVWSDGGDGVVFNVREFIAIRFPPVPAWPARRLENIGFCTGLPVVNGAMVKQWLTRNLQHP
jgi:hypothetical protein